MATPLDEVRERSGLRSVSPEPTNQRSAGTQTSASIRLGDVAQAGRYPAEELSTRTRLFIGGAAAAAGIVALTHGLLADALASDHAGAWNVARALVSWPFPVAQQVVAAIAAVTLLVIALSTEGYDHVSPGKSWPLLAATIAAVLGAGPTVLVCAVTAVVWALIIVLVIVVVIAILAVVAMAL
jgi:hypothetical protein